MSCVHPKKKLSSNDYFGDLLIFHEQGVLEYATALFFAKLVAYTFLFWLPYYITFNRKLCSFLWLNECLSHHPTLCVWS